MKFGLSRFRITPDFPVCLACSQQKDTLSERIHDDIYMGCMILENEGDYVLIISYDLLFHSRDLHEFIYDLSFRLYGVESKNILINFTHNHNSPSTLGYNDFSSSPEYEDLLKVITADAVKKAFTSMENGWLEYGEIPGRWAVNRRRQTKQGIKLAPNPDGNTDDRIYLMRLVSSDGSTKGLLVNYACHPVHYPDTLALTSEYPGFLCRYLENHIEGCIPLFIQGAGADTRPASTAEGDRFVHRSFDYIGRMAFEMGSEIVSFIRNDKFKRIDPCFRGYGFTLEVPFEDEGIEYFKACIENEGLSAHLRRNATEMVYRYDSLGNSFTLECGLIRLGVDLFVVHMGGEPCCEVKFNIMDIFENKSLIFAGYTDASAYIVTDGMLEKGGYEVGCFLEYMHKGRIKPGIDSIIRKGYADAFLQIQECPVPT